MAVATTFLEFTKHHSKSRLKFSQLRSGAHGALYQKEVVTATWIMEHFLNANAKSKNMVH